MKMKKKKIENKKISYIKGNKKILIFFFFFIGNYIDMLSMIDELLQI